MGAVKGEQEGGDPAAAENAAPAQSEIAADAGEQAFENVPVGDDAEGAKATRYVDIFWGTHFGYRITLHNFPLNVLISINFNFFLFNAVVRLRVLVFFQMCNQK